MRLPATGKWVLLALLGLAIAIGVAFAAANLASRQIGIASESVSAGNALAPALQAPGASGPRNQPPSQTTTTEPTTTSEEPPPEETTESDDHGGDDHGGGEDHSGHGGGGDSDGDDD